MPVSNCKRCNKIFKRQYSPYCPTCYTKHMSTFSTVYRFLQAKATNRLTLEEVAKHCSVTVREVEDIFLSGELGTAAHKVIYNCQLCDMAIGPIPGRRRLCRFCTEKMETEGKLNQPLEKTPTTYARQEQQRLVEDKQAKIQRARELAAEQEAEEAAASASSLLEEDRFGFKRHQ